jgi:hypothetical protein
MIDTRYFWLKERIDQGDIIPMYLLTNDMISDLLTKPMHGAQFLVQYFEAGLNYRDRATAGLYAF